jgi:hypothetical protein
MSAFAGMTTGIRTLICGEVNIEYPTRNRSMPDPSPTASRLEIDTTLSRCRELILNLRRDLPPQAPSPRHNISGQHPLIRTFPVSATHPGSWHYLCTNSIWLRQSSGVPGTVGSLHQAWKRVKLWRIGCRGVLSAAPHDKVSVPPSSFRHAFSRNPEKTAWLPAFAGMTGWTFIGSMRERRPGIDGHFILLNCT